MSVSIYSRYYNLALVEINGRVSLVQRPVAPAQEDGLLHTVVGGETLDQLAAVYYGREDLWWIIADADPARFPLAWQPGETLLIPPIEDATRAPRR